MFGKHGRADDIKPTCGIVEASRLTPPAIIGERDTDQATINRILAAFDAIGHIGKWCALTFGIGDTLAQNRGADTDFVLKFDHAHFEKRCCPLHNRNRL